MKAIAIVFLFAAFVSGCTTMMPYQSVGVWDEHVKTLGPVSFCQGSGCGKSDEGWQWPLGDHTQKPAQENIYGALLSKTARKYNVLESTVVLKDVNVKFTTEMDGTMRGWLATAMAGTKSAL